MNNVFVLYCRNTIERVDILDVAIEPDQEIPRCHGGSRRTLFLEWQIRGTRRIAVRSRIRKQGPRRFARRRSSPSAFSATGRGRALAAPRRGADAATASVEVIEVSKAAFN